MNSIFKLLDQEIITQYFGVYTRELDISNLTKVTILDIEEYFIENNLSYNQYKSFSSEYSNLSELEKQKVVELLLPILEEENTDLYDRIIKYLNSKQYTYINGILTDNLQNDRKLIDDFKSLIQPDNEKNYDELNSQFLLVINELRKKNYVVYLDKQSFYDFSVIGLREFANNRIRNYLIERDGNTTVAWAHRRLLISEFDIKKKINIISNDIQLQMNDINFIEVNEQNFEQTLADIANYIEFKLKTKNGFIDIDKVENYNNMKVINRLIDNVHIRMYRKKLQCFRHHTESSILERNNISKNEMKILISYGHTICMLISQL